MSTSKLPLRQHFFLVPPITNRLIGKLFELDFVRAGSQHRDSYQDMFHRQATTVSNPLFILASPSMHSFLEYKKLADVFSRHLNANGNASKEEGSGNLGCQLVQRCLTLSRIECIAAGFQGRRHVTHFKGKSFHCIHGSLVRRRKAYVLFSCICHITHYRHCRCYHCRYYLTTPIPSYYCRYHCFRLLSTHALHHFDQLSHYFSS